MREGTVLPVELMARREAWSTGVSIRMRQVTVGGGEMVALPMQWAHYEAGTVCEPLVTLPIQEAQKLMDELWDCGLRPSEGSGSAGALAATERHLKDMQKIVEKFMANL